MALVPYAQLTGYLPQDAIGTLQSPPEFAIWNLVDDFQNNNLPSVTGFELSPDGNYLLQQSITQWEDNGPTHWTPNLTFDTGTYAAYTDPGTGLQGITQTNGAVDTVFYTTINRTHLADVYGGLALRLRRPAPPSVPSGPYELFLYLNTVPSGYPAGTPMFRLSIIYGQPIALEVSFDNSNWAAVSSMQGSDSEGYLDSCDRTLTLDVVPLFDSNYYQNYPASFKVSSRPPDSLQININGGQPGAQPLVFNLPQGTFAAGSIGIKGTGGVWSIMYGNREYYPAPTLTTNINPNQTPYYGSAEPSMLAYFPTETSANATPFYPFGTINQVAAQVDISVDTTGIDVLTGNAFATCAINMLNLFYPPVFEGPFGGSPQWQFNFFSGTSLTDGALCRINRWKSSEVFTQSSFSRKASLDVNMSNHDLSLTPADVPLANRVVTWAIGWYDPETGASDIEDLNFTGQLATEIDGKPAFRWRLTGDGLYSLSASFDDFLNTSIKCGYLPAFDGQNMYTVMRICGYKLGFTDQRMNFPYRGWDDDSPEFHLDSGSSYAPKWQPHPEEGLVDFMLRVRGVCGAPDPYGGFDSFGEPLIVPMVLYADSAGVLEFSPWPVGWTNNYSPFSPVLPVPAKTYTIGEQFINGVPQLAALLEIGTYADLSGVRTNVQIAGRDPISGQYVTAGAVNNSLDGSSASNPYASGYLGYEKDLFLIDAQYTSQDTCDQTLGLVEQQVSVPIIGTDPVEMLLQPGLHALNGFGGNPFIGIDVPGVTGTSGVVPFWVLAVYNEGEITPNEDGSFGAMAKTRPIARGIGQSG